MENNRNVEMRVEMTEDGTERRVFYIDIGEVSKLEAESIFVQIKERFSQDKNETPEYEEKYER